MKPEIGLFVFKQHIPTGRYVIGKIIDIHEGLLMIDIVDCRSYGYGNCKHGRYEGCPYLCIYTMNDYEILIAKTESELIAKVL